jgi:hypothetical protein
VELGAGQHGGADRVHAAGDDVLESDDDLGPDDQRVDHQVGGRGVAAAAADLDGEVVLAGHDRSGARQEVAGG